MSGQEVQTGSSVAAEVGWWQVRCGGFVCAEAVTWPTSSDGRVGSRWTETRWRYGAVKGSGDCSGHGHDKVPADSIYLAQADR